MPYIITRTNAHLVPLERRAVATLDEARDTVQAILDRPDPAYRRASSDALIADMGGAVGPLPDGTVIEVEPIDWSALIDRLPDLIYPYASNAAVIDAYNAAQ